MVDFSGKTVLVTGSSRGIGLAIAKAFQAAGARLILHARSAISADVLAEFDQPLTIQADIADAEAVEAEIKRLYKDEGVNIDVLVNNAGITNDNLVLGMDPDDFASVVNTNLNGTFNVAQPIFKKMMRARSGAIINISSVIGLMGNLGQANYAASKAGIIGLTKSLAKEGARRGVRVNAVAPGMIVSDMTDVLTDDVKDQIMAQIPLSRFGTAEEVADVVLFLANNAFITGQTITIDGGMYI